MSKSSYKYEQLSQGEGLKGRGQAEDRPPWWINIWRGVNLIMALFFFLAALVQVCILERHKNNNLDITII